MRRYLVAMLILCACEPNPGHAKRTLESAGFSRISLNGYPFLKCSEDDNFNVSFSAVNVNEQVVTGALCCGMFKNCTIRLD